MIISKAEEDVAMTARQAFTREQIIALTKAVKEICAQRGVDPQSRDGQAIAARVVEEFSGGETFEEMQRRLRLH